jgi:hypothetical protein
MFTIQGEGAVVRMHLDVTNNNNRLFSNEITRKTYASILLMLLGRDFITSVIKELFAMCMRKI